MKNNMNTEWIIDRLPTFEDSYEGDVWVTYADGKMEKRYFRHVKQNTPWHHIHVPEPYVNPKRWTVKWDERRSLWAIFDWDLRASHLCGLPVEAVEAAQQIEDIYNKVMP